MIEVAKLYILISLWMALTFIQDHSCMRNKKTLVSHFSQIGKPIWMKLSILPQPGGLLKFMLDLVCISTVQGRELCWCNLMKYRFDFIMCQNACKQIYFIFGLMLSTPKLYSLIPVWMTLMFIQDHRISGKLELMQSFCKFAWSKLGVHDGW